MPRILLFCRQLVQNVDTDGSNGVSVSEMVEWMVRLEKAETLKGLQNQFREADRNSNGYVTLTEFAHTMASIGESSWVLVWCTLVTGMYHNSIFQHTTALTSTRSINRVFGLLTGCSAVSAWLPCVAI